jgi:NAD(P)-dependent dehydrogenase (short-subunit alcohol dehydrogenase family)
MSEFSDRVVVVTGAFGALGRNIASAFAAAGARVALLDVAPSPPAALAQKWSAPHLLIGNVQLTNEQQTVAALTAIASKLGRVNTLVNVAGGFRWEKIADGSVDTWDLLYGMNLKTALITSRAALPHLLLAGPGNSIVNIGAGAASKYAAAGMGAYTASKAGVQKLTESLADEMKDRGITVNAILPGTIDTPQNRKDMPDADFSRWVTPQAIADVVLFLASSRASAVTGAAIPVNGRG